MMRPQAGDIGRYDDLWHRQHVGGETGGRKGQPVALAAVVTDKAGRTNLVMLAITSTHPGSDRIALEVPQIECRRAGLDDMPLRIMLDEDNHDSLEGSFVTSIVMRVSGGSMMRFTK
jgi:hypothetical protein